jgi:hypothetical protein
MNDGIAFDTRTGNSKYKEATTFLIIMIAKTNQAINNSIDHDILFYRRLGAVHNQDHSVERRALSLFTMQRTT